MNLQKQCICGSKILEQGALTHPYFHKWGPMKRNGNQRLCVTINTNALSRFSEGHIAAQLSVLCGILLNCTGIPQCRALDPSLNTMNPQ